MSTRSVTLAAVAAEAGVHLSTVSRTISRPDLVKPGTRRTVQATIDRLGYRPDRGARALVSGRHSMLGLVVPDIVNPFFAEIVRAVQQHAAQADELVLVADSNQDPHTELALVGSLAREVDGIIVCVPLSSNSAIAAAATTIPLVFVNRHARGGAAVVVDQQATVSLAVDHLRDLGHTKIGYIQGPPRYWSTVQRASRLASLGVPVLGHFEPTFPGGREAASHVIASGVSGVAAFNDVMALGLIAELNEHGLRVPDDLSVVGSDDTPLATMSSPELSSVAAPATEIAGAAVDMLFAFVDGTEPRPNRVSVPVGLSVRSSTAPPGEWAPDGGPSGGFGAMTDVVDATP